MSIETIGYTEPNAQERIDAFLAQEHAVLVDIRQTPRSRWYPRFNRRALDMRYSGRYLWLPDLGNINHREKDRHKGIVLANPDAGIHSVLPLLDDDWSVMLLCACKDYEKCHRKVVYELVMAELSKAGQEVTR